MQVTMKEKPVSAGIWMRRWRPVRVAALFLCTAIMFGACSEDDSNEGEGGSLSPSVVRVESSNSNMPETGSITSQYGGVSSDTDLSKIIDRNVNTAYRVNNSRFYLLYAADKAVKVNVYTLRAGNGPTDEDPQAWVLSGSNDNASWTELDVQSGQTFDNRYQQKEYLFDNATEYRYYRLEVTANGGAPSTQIAEWTMTWKDLSATPEQPHSVELPADNANMPTAGTLTAQYSDYQEGEDVSRLVDDDNNTAFSSQHDRFYLLWEAAESTAVNYYSLVSANDNPDTAPAAWVLSGSNDNVTWTQLDSRSEQVFSGRMEEKDFLLDNQTAYKFYKLEIDGNNGGAVTKIAEWILQDSFNIDDLMVYSSGHTEIRNTPMGVHFENSWVQQETTPEIREWLGDPNCEPDPTVYDGGWTLKEFPVTLYPFGEPLPADVNQHAIGNCSALAVLGSMAYIYPDFIRSLITDNGDNTYTIDMFDPQGKPIKVSISNKFFADGSGNMTCCTGKDSRATWSTVLEKAMMKWEEKYKANFPMGGIGSEHAAPLFTGVGNSFAFAPNSLNSANLTRAVQVSLAQGKIVVGGFNRGDMVAPDGSGKTVTGHAWTLMWTAHPSALFSMRNPWGFCYDADGARDGVLNIFEGEMPPTIDLRIIDPGKAAEYGSGRFDAYTPPLFAPQPVRVAEHLLRSGQ